MSKWCPRCKKEVPLSQFYNNKRRSDGKQSYCKTCMKIHNVVNYKKHKKSWNKRSREYMKTEKWKEYKRNYMNNRYKNDLQFCILTRLRSRMYEAIRKYGGEKECRTIDYLGCSIKTLKRHLESQFVEGMSWENSGTKWHVDHVVPCAAFDLREESEQKICFWYKNLQPLYAGDNIRKSNKYRQEDKEALINLYNNSV